MSDQIVEGLDEVQKGLGVSDPNARKRNSLWFIAMFGIFGFNPVVDYFNGISESTLKEYADAQAVLAKSLSDHIQHADNRLDDLMEQINYNDLKSQISDDIRSIEFRMELARERKVEINLERTRSETNGRLPAELEAAYASQIRMLESQISQWEREVKSKKQQLFNASGSD